MSEQAIHHYYNRLNQYQRCGGTRNESSIRRAFANLLEEYCVPRHLVLVDELHQKGSQKRPDGTVKNANRLDWGHWESKDSNDVLNDQILAKLDKGYPTFNILFENSVDIVLIQEGEERLRGKMADADVLDRILTAFVAYERPEIQAFREAIDKFRADIPGIVEKLRAMITEQSDRNPAFKQARATFWEFCRKSINPDITEFDIEEMLIQHMLTAEIFNTIFAEADFHRENTVARKLERVVNTFFTGALRRNTLAGMDSYYKAITTEASRMTDHHEKQTFLKVVYENFYTAYNPKGADRLGIVYTPNEIVDFMIKSTDDLLEQHFGRALADKNVDILDPATGTGTFITDIIAHIPPQDLTYKYTHEIHANEVAILPYYIANSNIEFTYRQKMGTYVPFENLVFADTLQNFGFGVKGQPEALFGSGEENLERIKKQNTKKISVIIGNPPYNAKQQLYNDFNPNQRYRRIDARIKQTYIKQGTAQNQLVVYDMYTRFIRWATERIAENGVIAFVTNRSYIDKRAFDGFRKCVAQEFDDIYVIDTRSDVRDNPKITGTTHNVFGIRTGVAVIFFVKRSATRQKHARIHYFTLTDDMRKREKLAWFAEHHLRQIEFTTIHPDQHGNWLDIIDSDHDFESLLPLIDKDVKAGKSNTSVFTLFSRGIETTRDDWVYDFSEITLRDKMRFSVDTYNDSVAQNALNHAIKWSASLKEYFNRKRLARFNEKFIIPVNYRPYIKKYYYADPLFSHRLTRNHFDIFGKELSSDNILICLPGRSSPQNFHTISFTNNFDFNALPAGSQSIPVFWYDQDGNRIDNITDWGLQQFQAHYAAVETHGRAALPGDTAQPSITKQDIFHYTYAVLHNPVYRQKYEINLKREFPRLPFYADFWQWAAWGRTLMELHLNYESVEPYPLELQEERIPKPDPKVKLRAIPNNGAIILDENTALLGIPALAWDYTLGNRSALHWILDQYKEKTPKDPTIAAQFNTYEFSGHKTQVIDLLRRVCTVSVKTMEIVHAMAAAQD